MSGMSTKAAGRAGLLLVLLGAAIGTVGWFADGGAVLLPLRSSPPPSAGEQLRELMALVLAAAATLVAAGRPAPFVAGSARVGWAATGFGAALAVLGSEGPFLTNAYALSWPFWAYLGGIGVTAIALAVTASSTLRSAGRELNLGLPVIAGTAGLLIGGGLTPIGFVAIALGLARLLLEEVRLPLRPE